MRAATPESEPGSGVVTGQWWAGRGCGSRRDTGPGFVRIMNKEDVAACSGQPEDVNCFSIFCKTFIVKYI